MLYILTTHRDAPVQCRPIWSASPPFVKPAIVLRIDHRPKHLASSPVVVDASSHAPGRFLDDPESFLLCLSSHLPPTGLRSSWQERSGDGWLSIWHWSLTRCVCSDLLRADTFHTGLYIAGRNPQLRGAWTLRLKLYSAAP
jgi:hypothetical protein